MLVKVEGSGILLGDMETLWFRSGDDEATRLLCPGREMR
jgi:hypothetical protein